MKKVSIAAAKPSRNFFEQKLTIGLDLGGRSSWYCGLDAADQAISLIVLVYRDLNG